MPPIQGGAWSQKTTRESKLLQMVSFACLHLEVCVFLEVFDQVEDGVEGNQHDATPRPESHEPWSDASAQQKGGSRDINDA